MGGVGLPLSFGGVVLVLVLVVLSVVGLWCCLSSVDGVPIPVRCLCVSGLWVTLVLLLVLLRSCAPDVRLSGFLLTAWCLRPIYLLLLVNLI